ncbi:GOLPH3/VPS74 family protein [Crossiella sp. NPDC003009]
MNLPEQLYLLACDPERRRVPERDKLGRVLRAAALTDLVLRGRLTDADDRPTTDSVKPTGDQLLDEVLAEVSRDKPRKWRAWVSRNHRPMLKQVQAGLARTGAISVRQRRALGLFPVDEVTVHDAVGRERLRERVRSVVIEERTGAAAETALAALAATGELRMVLTARERRQHKAHIKELLAAIGPAGPALRKVIDGLKAAHSAAVHGGGG